MVAAASRSSRAKPLGDLARTVVQRSAAGFVEVQDTGLEALTSLYSVDVSPEQRASLTPTFAALANIVRTAGELAQMNTFLLADKSTETNRLIDAVDAAKRKRESKR